LKLFFFKCVCKKQTFFRAFRIMKNLILIRHASAESEQFPFNDFDRRLTETGISETRKLAEFLLSTKFQPDKVVCSAAKRTFETAGIITETLFIQQSAIEIPALYNAGFQVLLQHIQSFGQEQNTIALVGHNPGISQIATVLSSNNPYQFSTASALCLEFKVESWSAVQSGMGKENWYYNP